MPTAKTWMVERQEGALNLTRPRRILFCSSMGYPPQFYGGSQNSVQQMCAELNRRGHVAGVLCRLKSNGLFGLKKRLRLKFANGHCVVDRQSGVLTLRCLDVLGAIQEVVERFRPDLVVAEAGSTLAVARRFIELGLPTVASIRDVEFDRQQGGFFKHARLQYLANSEFTQNRLKTTLDIDSTVIPPLVDRMQYSTENLGSYVLHINPHPIKGIDTTMSLAKLRPDVKFLVCESWPLTPHIRKELKAKYGNLTNVEFRKPVSDMRTIYSNARCLLVPSIWDEAWGRVVTEAHMSGIPVIARAVGALPEAVGPGGILIPPYAPLAAWAQALSALWDEPDQHQAISLTALSYSQRVEISSSTIIDRLLHLIETHIERSAIRN